MSFLYPALLAGLAAVAIPIAIHLLNKFRVKNVQWGAMRFLQESLKRNERRVKIEDLILLILRCLFVILIVTAFARPVIKSLSMGGNDSSGPVLAVVLLDNSASMMQSDGTQTRFDLARKEIRDWIDQRDKSSQAALYLVSDHAEPLLAKPESNFALFRKMLETAQPSNQSTDLSSGIQVAYQILKQLPGHNREIRIYTDDQTCAWNRLDDIRKLAQENPDIAIKPVVVGKQGEDNLGVVDVSLDGNVPAAKQPCRIRVEVANYGKQAAKDVHVSLSIDEDAPINQTVIPNIDANTTQAISISIDFPTSGPHAVTATIPPDALPVDNQRTLAIDVVSRKNVLLVETSGNSDSVLDRDGYFLANALLPYTKERASKSYLELQFSTLDQITPDKLAGIEAVFLCNPGSVSAQVAQTLRDYTSSGGNLVIFPGPQTDAEQWKQNAVWSDLLPATLSAAQHATGDSQMIGWQTQNFQHPITELWNDPGQGGLGTVKLFQYFPLKLKPPTAGAKPAVIVNLINGEPSVVEWKRGNGRVVLFNSAASPQWNNFPVHPAFVPFVQRLMGYLSRKSGAHINLIPGEPFVLDVPAEWAGREFTVQGPEKGSRQQPGGTVLSDGTRTVIRYSDTAATGRYQIFMGRELVGNFAVQLDPSESDLRQMDVTSLQTLSQPIAGEKSAPVAAHLVVSREFWTELMWIVGFILLAESALAHQFSRSK